MEVKKRLKLIACEIMFREICYCAARCRNIVDITFMPKGLHDIGETKMNAKLQAEIDQTDPERYEAILLGYGLCNNGVRGLHAPLPLVITRAHDCITLLLGSREKYREYFDHNPGTFFQSTGWVERNTDPNDQAESVTSQLGMSRTYQEYLEKYGEENARFLFETLGDWLKNYQKVAYIDTGIGAFPACREAARQQAAENGWAYEELAGDTRLICKLLNGDWDPEEFLVVPPQQKILPVYGDETIIKSE